MPTLTHSEIRKLLAKRREIAVIWSADDVREIRPDLTPAQSWKVLQECKNVHNCHSGCTWDFIESVAEDLFPNNDEGDDQ